MHHSKEQEINAHTNIIQSGTFEVASFCWDTFVQTLPEIVQDCRYHFGLHSIPGFFWSAFQGLDGLVLDCTCLLLYNASGWVVNRIYVGGVWWPITFCPEARDMGFTPLQRLCGQEPGLGKCSKSIWEYQYCNTYILRTNYRYWDTFVVNVMGYPFKHFYKKGNKVIRNTNTDTCQNMLFPLMRWCSESTYNDAVYCTQHHTYCKLQISRNTWTHLNSQTHMFILSCNWFAHFENELIAF